MKYLFLDLEFASQMSGISKVCEFGYVLTNEKFEIIEKNNFIINPDIYYIEWNKRVLRDILNRDMSEYEKSPNFKYYYEKIKDLLMSSDYIIGHSTIGDIDAINCELKRYEYEPLKFKFIDVKEIYKAYNNINTDISVHNILNSLDLVGDDNIHDAESDAYNTMLEFKELLNRLEVNIEEMLILCPECLDYCENYKIASIENKNKNLQEDSVLTDSSYISKNTYRRVVESIKPNKTGNGLLKGKKIYIGYVYIRMDFKRAIKLAQIIANEGGLFVRTKEEGDILVACLEGEVIKFDELCVNDSTKKVILIDEFYNMINTSEEEVEKMKLPTIELYKRKGSFSFDECRKKEKITLGDLIKEKMGK